MRLDADGQPVLAVTTIQIDYSLFSLLQGRINEITLNGLEVQLEVTDKGITLPGLSRRPPSTTGQEGNGKPFRLETLLPLELNAVVIQKARPTVHWQNHSIEVPFDLSLNTSGLKQGVLIGRGRFKPRGNEINLTFETRSGKAEVILNKSHLMLDRFADLFDDGIPISAAGKVDLNGRTTFQLDPLQWTGLSVSAGISDIKISSPGVQIENLPMANSSTAPLQIELKMDGQQHFQWQCAPFQLTTAAKIQVAALEGKLAPSTNGWQFKAHTRADIPAQVIDTGPKPGMIFKKTLSLLGDIHGQHTQDNGVEFELSAGPDAQEPNGELFLDVAGRTARSRVPRLALTGAYKDQSIKTRFKVTTHKIRVDLPDGAFSCPEWILNGDAAITSTLSLQAEAKLTDAELAIGSTSVQIPQTIFRAQIRQTRNSPLSLVGDLEIARARVDDPQYGFKVRGLSGRIPLGWPQSRKTPAGKIKAAGIQWRSHQLGGLQGALNQQPAGLQAEIQHNSKLFPGLFVHINMKADKTGAALAFQVPTYQPKKDLDLGLFSSAAAGLMVNGRLEARAEMIFKGASAQSNARVKIDNGRLQDESRNMNLTGISLDLHLDDLMALSSPPGQKFRIEALEYGRMTAADFDVDFKIEPGHSVFIKNAGLHWCQGDINVKPFRITPGVEEYDLTLLCDGLNLSMLLEQLEAAKASGDGTVSGRIPLRWSKGRLGFHNGVLSSPAGVASVIRISDTDYLLAGLPPDTPQRIQLEIATEALKDYTYKWAKLHLHSQQDDLLVQLQVDGKPNRLLPFAFDKQLGSFKRVPGKGQAEFKGISIDLNFKSPLDEILHYKKLLTPKLQ